MPSATHVLTVSLPLVVLPAVVPAPLDRMLEEAIPTAMPARLDLTLDPLPLSASSVMPEPTRTRTTPMDVFAAVLGSTPESVQSSALSAHLVNTRGAPVKEVATSALWVVMPTLEAMLAPSALPAPTLITLDLGRALSVLPVTGAAPVAADAQAALLDDTAPPEARLVSAALLASTPVPSGRVPVRLALLAPTQLAQQEAAPNALSVSMPQAASHA